MVNNVLLRGTDKRKYWELIHDFSIQYAINNDQYPKTIQESVDVMRKVKLKPERNNGTSNTQKQNKNEGGEQDKKMK